MAVIAGCLPPRAMGLVAEWASLHRSDLDLCWRRARELQAPGKIEPLR